MTWRDLLAATGAGLIAAALSLWLSLAGHVVGDADGGAIAGAVHVLLHGATLLSAMIGLVLAMVVRLDPTPPSRLDRLRTLRGAPRSAQGSP
jgi:hypothetical protein